MLYLNNKEIEFLECLNNQLRRANVACVALRGFEGLPTRIENDLDVLVDDLFKAQTTACDIADALGLSAEIVEENYQYAGMLIAGRLRLDFFSALVKGWARYLDEELVVETSRRCDVFFPHVSSVVYIAMVAAKECLTYGFIRPRKKVVIESMINNQDLSKDMLAAVLGSCFSAESVGKLVQAIYSAESKKIAVRRKWTELMRPLNALVWFGKRIRYKKWKRPVSMRDIRNNQP